MPTLLHVALLVLAPTALWFAVRAALPWLLRRRLIDSEILLATVAIAAFGQSFSKSTGLPAGLDLGRLQSNPVTPLLILVGFVFCVLAVRAYALERRAVPRPGRGAPDPSLAPREYVARFADHFQLYGLGLALILLGA